MATFVTSIAYNNQNLTTPVVDATAYKGNIDIDLKTSLNNLEQLEKDLENYGVELKTEDRNINMLVIRDKEL